MSHFVRVKTIICSQLSVCISHTTKKNVKHSDKTRFVTTPNWVHLFSKSNNSASCIWGNQSDVRAHKTASLSSKTNCDEVRNCHLKYDVKKRELDYSKWRRKCRRTEVYPSTTGIPRLCVPNVERRSNVIMFLPNTNLNNIRVMSLISVFIIIIIIIIIIIFKTIRAIKNNGWLIMDISSFECYKVSCQFFLLLLVVSEVTEARESVRSLLISVYVSEVNRKTRKLRLWSYWALLSQFIIQANLGLKFYKPNWL